MSFSEAVGSCFSNYACFSGRARRSEYWFFCLFQIIVSFCISIFSIVPHIGILFSVLNVIFALVCFIPGLAVSVRRLHDTGHSGKILLLPAIGGIMICFAGYSMLSSWRRPGNGLIILLVIGIIFTIVTDIILLVLYCTGSDYDRNEYGPGPGTKSNSSERKFSIPKNLLSPFPEEDESNTVVKINKNNVPEKTVVMINGKPVLVENKSEEKDSSSINSEELVKLKKLLDDGIITQEDFDKKKSQLLGL